MLRAAEAWLVERGAPKLNLHGSRENKAVLAFYQSQGYRWPTRSPCSASSAEADGEGTMATLERSLAERSKARGSRRAGAFALDVEERRGALAGVKTIALVGMAGARGWTGSPRRPRRATASPIRSIVGAEGSSARSLTRSDALALYPFGGPPYWPFQRWAKRAEPMHASPLGLLVHPVVGSVARLPRRARLRRTDCSCRRAKPAKAHAKRA